MRFYIWYGLAALFALFCAVRTYRQRGRLRAFTGNLFLSAAAANIAYAVRIGVSTYTMASLWTSIYFICTDFLVLAVFQYALEFTESKLVRSKYKKGLYLASVFLVLVDAAFLIVNFFNEIEFSLQYNTTGSIYAIKYMYVSKAPFYIHLGFVFFLAGSAACVLLFKMWNVPAIYKERYRNSLIVLLALMGFSISYLTEIIRVEIDVSVLVYGFVCPLIYWNTFDYSSKGMLNSTRKMILEYMNTPMVLFDYEGYVADTNQDMRNLFPVLDGQERRMSMVDFMQIAAFKELQDTVTDQVFEWQNPNESGAKVYQCHFNCLKDKKGRIIGHLLVMRSMEIERDLLTRLDSKRTFYTRVNNFVGQNLYPVTIVMCNTNGIGLVNDVYGWSKGNEMLRLAADLLREHLPKTAVIARMDGGDMAAGFMQTEQEYATRLFENIREEYRAANDTGINADIEYGIAVIRDSGMSVEEALKEASDSMRMKKMMNETSQKSSLLDSLTQTLTESDYETEEHVERTKDMAIKLGKALNLSDSELGKLALLAVLHDIGKIAIPHSILLKPGKLTDEEWEIMKSHTEKGYRIASASKELQSIAEYILHHHERWDGNGYPGRLKEDEIPLLSRIITVVDSHDVMVHDRPYHKAMSHEAAVEELRRCSGTQFDPHLVTVFLDVIGGGAA